MLKLKHYIKTLIREESSSIQTKKVC